MEHFIPQIVTHCRSKICPQENVARGHISQEILSYRTIFSRIKCPVKQEYLSYPRKSVLGVTYRRMRPHLFGSVLAHVLITIASQLYCEHSNIYYSQMAISVYVVSKVPFLGLCVLIVEQLAKALVRRSTQNIKGIVYEW